MDGWMDISKTEITALRMVLCFSAKIVPAVMIFGTSEAQT